MGCGPCASILKEINKSLCKITVKKSEGNYHTGTGFFMNIGTNKFLITNYHIISPEEKNDDIEIKIWNQNIMKLNLSNRKIKYYPKPKDITAIEINNGDNIFNDIRFLNYDPNYKNGYDAYKNKEIFSIQYPFGNNANYVSGKIENINIFQFYYNMEIDDELCGCPIIISKNSVIGIHKGKSPSNNLNCGTFIGEIFNDNIYSYINAEIDIKDDQVNNDIIILNSLEESKRIFLETEKGKEEINEEEIKNCKITIDNELIPLSYKHKFKNKGKHSIQYLFINGLTKTNYLFLGCESLINIDLSYFDTQNITDMSGMFQSCSSLTNINLSNFHTQNVTNMSGMFLGCESLKNLDLSKFNTQNVTDMSFMFHECKSLTILDLYNFETKNVKDMHNMFYDCISLTGINLSSFNTKNVTNMGLMFFKCGALTRLNISNFDTSNVTIMKWMFYECKSLTYLDLSNFYTRKVTDMSWMFYECKSLMKLNLSNFDTKNVEDMNNMNNMFQGCVALKKENIITKDKKIISVISKF